jgi:hypothetical protein
LSQLKASLSKEFSAADFDERERIFKQELKEKQKILEALAAKIEAVKR